jgi:hypothetical protein
MKWFFLGLLLVTGCGGEPAPLGEDTKELAAGERCVDDAECASTLCLPSNTTQFDASYCFDRSADGCMVVTAPFELAAQCTKPFGKTYVCGDSWDVAGLGQCDDLGNGKLGETYRCCAPEVP